MESQQDMRSDNVDYDPSLYTEEGMVDGEIVEMPGPGELTCYCRPTRVLGASDFFTRTGLWFLINKEQLLNGITGASKPN